MYQQAVGFNPGGKLLSGLSKKGDVGAFAKGQAMAGAAGLNMGREKANQDFGVEQMRQQSQLRQQDNQNMGRHAMNSVQENDARGQMSHRARVFDMGMNFDYASLQKRRSNQLQQSLLNNLARDF